MKRLCFCYIQAINRKPTPNACLFVLFFLGYILANQGVQSNIFPFEQRKDVKTKRTVFGVEGVECVLGAGLRWDQDSPTCCRFGVVANMGNVSQLEMFATHRTKCQTRPALANSENRPWEGALVVVRQ